MVSSLPYEVMIEKSLKDQWKLCSVSSISRAFKEWDPERKDEK